MFNKLTEKFKIRKALNEWRSSTLGQALDAHSRKCFYGSNELLGSFSDEGKQETIQDLYQLIYDIAKADDDFLKYRNALAYYVREYASFQVLCLTEEEKKADYYSDCPYISGELYKHIQLLAKHNDVLNEYKWKQGDVPDEELIKLCNIKCAVLLYYLNGLNIVRIELKDVVEEKDWLRPFVKSMLIWQEDEYREKYRCQLFYQIHLMDLCIAVS